MEKSWMELNEELRLEIESLQNPVMESILLPVPSDLLEEISESEFSKLSEFVEADGFEILAESSILEENLKPKELQESEE
jgi:hypothetical protein